MSSLRYQHAVLMDRIDEVMKESKRGNDDMAVSNARMVLGVSLSEELLPISISELRNGKGIQLVYPYIKGKDFSVECHNDGSIITIYGISIQKTKRGRGSVKKRFQEVKK